MQHAHMFVEHDQSVSLENGSKTEILVNQIVNRTGYVKNLFFFPRNIFLDPLRMVPKAS